MSSLPSGTVTFCFTDIEGSTRAFAKLGPRFLDLLEEHRRIIRDAVTRHRGAEVKTEGDGFFLAFGDATDAVTAAIDFQRALSEHDWPEDGAIRVRVGLHAGEAEPVDDDYLAFAVHEAARIGAAAHGGQTVLSRALADLIGDRLPDGVLLRDLGLHQLKDIDPVQILQICHPALPDDFPPLRSAAGVRGYLPTPTSSLIGRTSEIEDLTSALRGARLVTVTGAGGVGKTRIAVEAARTALGTRVDGVWFVDLAPVADPAWIPEAALGAIGVVRDPAVDPSSQLLSFLRDADALLVIDNCEHLIDACSALVDALLASCPRVSVVATSREPLGVPGEVAWRLRSLDSDESVELFLERARLAGSDLGVDARARDAIEQIVERVDGIPLAIELAAARTRVLTPMQIAERLDDRFRLLTGGSRTVLARQRTLEATVDWSYALLDEPERQLLRSLSVFVGGFSIDAAEAVGGAEALDLLERLVDKSLVGTRLAGDRIRYRLLETIRHYAWLRLLDASEMEDARDRHLAYIADLVDHTADGLRDARETEAVEMLTMEYDNIRSALEWATSRPNDGAAIRITSQMWMYWSVVGRTREGVDWIDRTLAAVKDAGDPDRLALLNAGAGHVKWLAHHSNEDVARHVRAAIDAMRSRDSDDVRWWDSFALARLAAIVGAGLPDHALSAEAVERALRAGDRFVAADVLQWHAYRIEERDGLAAARPFFEQAVESAQLSGASSVLAYALDAFSACLLESGELDDAVTISQRAVGAARRGPNVWFTCYALSGLGQAKALRGDPDARDHLIDALEVARDADLDANEAYVTRDLGWLAMRQGRPEEAQPLFERSASIIQNQVTSRPELLFEWGYGRFAVAESLQAQGNLDAAEAILSELLGLAEATQGARWTVAALHNALGSIALERGDIDGARSTYESAARIARESSQSALRERQAIASAVRGLAAVALATGDASTAAELSGAASHVFEPNLRSGMVNVQRNARVVAVAREQLGENAFDDAWRRGSELGLDQILVGAS